MIVTYQGGGCIKINYGDFSLAYNPPKKLDTGKVPRFGANIALISTHLDSVNGPENVEYNSVKPFVIDGPGNYEVSGLSIEGISSFVEFDKNNYINTVYKTELDGIKLVFLGLATDESLTPEFRGKVGTTDIVFIPLDHEELTAQMAYKIAVSTDASIIIPIGQDAKKIKDFLKEAGQEGVTMDKLTIKKKDLVGKTGEVVVLKL